MHPNETTLNDYVDRALDPIERSGVDQHLATCASCRQIVEDLRDILRSAGELELREPPARAWSRAGPSGYQMSSHTFTPTSTPAMVYTGACVPRWK